MPRRGTWRSSRLDMDNKSPGLDGLSYEFYKSVREEIGDKLVEVMNCQLERLKLVMSSTEGVTRVLSKSPEG